MATDNKFPSVDEVVKTDAFPTAVWQLEPHRDGMLPVAAGRGGPFNIHWEVHGEGPVKLVLIQGLGVLKTSWQRQTMHFGHLNSDRYSVLLLDNRGMGRSDKPLMRYSTSDMAADALEVLDHLSWTEDRQLHICGISMGGMIAQELAYVAPHRIASLNLLCTAAAIENTTSFSENMINRITMLLPKSLDRTITYTAEVLFPKDWLAGPDDTTLPDETVPRCHPPVGGWPYRRFASNYARFAAQEVAKQRDREGFTRPGFLLQTIAAGWHHKSETQLREIGDKVGRQRILVLHGTDDGIISIPHGRKLIEYLQPGKGLIVDGMGHAPIVERTVWFNELLAEMCSTGELLSGR
ncbi:Alpha/Beta hydrolase protein [Xylaria bambusicola]|uniref:Alpha/Beta hydrolase protein n=1 Tax=Xylaria bambusicola TaxID=326684 RepID=UPI002008874B|nr:Alpha/Beta hydrolase protein [Xylaria bambusicola]KAI0517096.1 Alpha/Beta hydrolase protein [Xylaria bambusicola]